VTCPGIEDPLSMRGSEPGRDEEQPGRDPRHNDGKDARRFRAFRHGDRAGFLDPRCCVRKSASGVPPAIAHGAISDYR
jgi:hypothetical protein